MDSIQQQVDISSSLINSLDSLMTNYSSISSRLSNTTASASQLVNSINALNAEFTQRSANNAMLIQEAISASQRSALNNQATITQNQRINQELLSSSNYVSRQQRNQQNAIQNAQNSRNEMNNATQSINDSSDSIQNSGAGLQDSAEALLDVADDADDFADVVDGLDKTVGAAVEIKNGFLTGGLSLIGTALKMGFYLLTTAVNVITTAAAAAAKFTAFTMTLPFTIANAFAQIGNKIREDMATIREAGEEAKESFDLTSRIGQGAAILTRKAQGMLKAFQNPRSLLVRLFGLGAAGAAEFQKQIFASADAMGHYAELFAKPLMSNTKLGLYFIQLQKQLGVSTQELGYYAMQAYISGRDPASELAEVRDAIKAAADKSGLDFKQLSSSFHKLRLNIIEFGSLTNFEIAKLTSKLRSMKVKTDDALSVFKKFSTFEEAAKASAQLFQTFEMNIDALDLLTARDPAEMLQQFRDAMFQTGKSFKDLNRHEKALMSSITGISSQSLSTLMNYMDLGYTQDEARKKMEASDPTKQQTKLVKSLTSAVKQYQKIMQYNSPFEAFYDGLVSNALGHKELDQTLIDFSRVYESLWHVGYSLDLETISGLLGPVNNILQRIKNVITGKKFHNILRQGVSVVKAFAEGVSFDLTKSGLKKDLIQFGYYIEELDKVLKDKKDTSLEIQEHVKSSFKKKYTDLKSIDENLKDLLIEHKVLIQDKNKKTLRITEQYFVGNLIKALNQGAVEFKDDPKILKQLNEVYSVLKTSVQNSAEEKLGQYEIGEVLKKSNKFTSIKGRIDNLYSHVLDLFTTGSSHFNSALDIGRDITKAVIVGIAQGATVMLKFASGQINTTVQSLGITITDEMKKEAKKKGKSIEEFTILDMVGLSKTEADGLTTELSKETVDFVSNLPTLMSLAGSLIIDMTSLFIKFAQGFASGVASVYYDFYNKQNPFVRLLLPMNNKIKLSNLESKGIFASSIGSLGQGYGERLKIEKEKGEDADAKDAKRLFDDYTIASAFKINSMLTSLIANAKPGTLEEEFLKGDLVRKFQNKINSDLFNTEMPGMSPEHFRDLHTAYHRVVSMAEDTQRFPEINNFSSSYANNKEFIEHYNNKKNNFLKNIISLYANTGSDELNRYINTSYGMQMTLSPQGYLDEMDMINQDKNLFKTNLRNAQDHRNKARNLNIKNILNSFNESRKQKEVSAEDASLKAGNNTLIIINGKVFRLDPQDYIYATKEKGYWNKVMISFSNGFFSYINFIKNKFVNILSNQKSSFEDLTFEIKNKILDSSQSISLVQNSQEEMIKYANKIAINYKNNLEEVIAYKVNNTDAIKNIENTNIKNIENTNIINKVDDIMKNTIKSLDDDETAVEEDLEKLFDLFNDIISICSTKKPNINTRVVV